MAAPAIRIEWAAAVTALVLAAAPAAAAPPEASAALTRGIEALHYFEYEEANQAFRDAHRLDPGLVMACWGEALTYHQTLWRNEDIKQARIALARCGPDAAARAARAPPRKGKKARRPPETPFGA